jgi:hypothetical protein
MFAPLGGLGVALSLSLASCARDAPRVSMASPNPTPAPASASSAPSDEDLTFENKCTYAAAPEPKPCPIPPALIDDVRRVGNEKLGAIQDCYSAALDRVGRRGGVLHVGWRIVEDGSVDCVNVVRDPMRDERFRACVLAAFADVRHPPMACGAAAEWKYRLGPPE